MSVAIGTVRTHLRTIESAGAVRSTAGVPSRVTGSHNTAYMALRTEAESIAEIR